MPRADRLALALAVVAVAAARSPAAAQDEPSATAGYEIPAAFAPFEHIVGPWKGQGIPTANKLRGWPERHLWAWAFADGKPVALTVEFEGSKILAKARLTHEGNEYRLDGTDADGKPVAYAGTLDDKKQNLTLERGSPLPDGARQRLILRLNSNQIRYLIWDERQPKGGSRFARSAEMQMGKEGESFAAGAAAANVPKCIITGGAATLSVSYNGQNYPVCCTGCRDEFEADPERWLKKLAARGGAASTSAPAPAPIAESKPKADPTPDDESTSAPKTPAAKDKAAELYDRATDLEKAGKTQAALTYYRMVVKDHPRSPQARQAATRIDALGGTK
jgi:YHS domain-containing protein